MKTALTNENLTKEITIYIVPSLNLVLGLLVNGLGLPSDVMIIEVVAPGLSVLNGLEGDNTGLLVLAV